MTTYLLVPQNTQHVHAHICRIPQQGLILTLLNRCMTCCESMACQQPIHDSYNEYTCSGMPSNIQVCWQCTNNHEQLTVHANGCSQGPGAGASSVHECCASATCHLCAAKYMHAQSVPNLILQCSICTRTHCRCSTSCHAIKQVGPCSVSHSSSTCWREPPTATSVLPRWHHLLLRQKLL